jgi:hypothetical protein
LPGLTWQGKRQDGPYLGYTTGRLRTTLMMPARGAAWFFSRICKRKIGASRFQRGWGRQVGNRARLALLHGSGERLGGGVKCRRAIGTQFVLISRATVRNWIRCKCCSMATYEGLVTLALFCANQARTSVMKDAACEAWRLAVEYRDQAAKLGEPPNIGEKPRHI